MEDWQIDFEWLKVRHIVKDAMSKTDLPDLRAVLFLIGIQELGRWDMSKNFSKEEKQDLLHVGVCTLLEEDGYFVFEGRDQDGWPHWKENKTFSVKGLDSQEKMLKIKIINYFRAMDLLKSEAQAPPQTEL